MLETLFGYFNALKTHGEQAMTLADLDPQEQQAMTFKRFSCPMCNNSSHVFKEKIEVETHILKKHKITIDMLKVKI